MPLTRYRAIHEDDDLIVFLKTTGSDVTIFAFNNYGTIYPTPQVWGTDFIDGSGFNAAVFMAKTRNWFPGRAMSPAIAAVHRHLGPPAFSFTFGNSMGGYAAIKYKKPLNADACLSFNPQYTIDPAACSFDRRFAAYWTPDMAGMDIVDRDVDRWAFVFYDPVHRQDAGHAAILSGMPGIHEIPVFHTGHVTVRSVVRGSTISDIVDIFRMNSADAAAQVRLLLRHRKKSSFDYYHSLAKDLLARNHPRMFLLLVDFMERHAQLKPAHVESIRQLALDVPPPPAVAEAGAASHVQQSPGSPEDPMCRAGDRPGRDAPRGTLGTGPPPLAARGGLPRFAAAAPAGPGHGRGWLGHLWTSATRRDRGG